MFLYNFYFQFHFYIFFHFQILASFFSNVPVSKYGCHLYVGFTFNISTFFFICISTYSIHFLFLN